MAYELLRYLNCTRRYWELEKNSLQFIGKNIINNFSAHKLWQKIELRSIIFRIRVLAIIQVGSYGKCVLVHRAMNTNFRRIHKATIR